MFASFPSIAKYAVFLDYTVSQWHY